MKNTYKTLFVKFLVFVVIFVAVDYVSGFLYRFLEDKALDNSPYAMVTQYTAKRVDSDIVIIGASEAQHGYVSQIIEDSLGRSTYNCGKDGCHIYYQEAMINSILNRYSPKMIIWSVTPDDLSSPSQKAIDGLSQLNSFYETDEYCRELVNKKSKYEPLKMSFQSYAFNSRLIPLLYKSFGEDYPYEKGYAPISGTELNLKRNQKVWENDCDEEMSERFMAILKRCKEQNVEPILVFTPRYEYDNHDDLVQYKKMKEIVNQLGVRLIEDLYHDEELMKVEYFRDYAHFNDVGAPLFTNKLIAFLE